MLLLTLIHFLGSCSRIPAVIHQFLFKVEKLALETGVRVDYTSLWLDKSHSLEKTPIPFMHQICYDTSRRAWLSSVTVTKKNKITTIDIDAQFFIERISIAILWVRLIMIETYQWTKTVPPEFMASLMNRTAPGMCFPMFSQGTSITLITLYVISYNK